MSSSLSKFRNSQDKLKSQRESLKDMRDFNTAIIWGLIGLGIATGGKAANILLPAFGIITTAFDSAIDEVIDDTYNNATETANSNSIRNYNDYSRFNTPSTEFQFSSSFDYDRGSDSVGGNSFGGDAGSDGGVWDSDRYSMGDFTFDGGDSLGSDGGGSDGESYGGDSMIE